MNFLSTSLTVVLLVFSTSVHALDIETVFNTPGFRGASTTTVEDKLIDLVRSAKIGSTIRGALYNIDRAPLMRELVLASQRGVDVEMVLDGGNLPSASIEGSAVNQLVSGFDGNDGLRCSGEDCVKFCHGPLQGAIKLLKIKKNYPLGGSCRGLVINHNKLFLFSELTDGSKNIVAQTSANMMAGQLKMYNDLIIIKNEENFFNGFMDYWQKLKGDKTVLLKKSFPTIHGEGDKLTSYFFPRMVSQDPVLELLKRVNCHLPNSSIRASQAAFTRSKVAREMERLKAEGCSLQVIARIDPTQSSPGKDVRQILGSDLVVLPFRGSTPEEQADNSIHTKVVLIDASIDGSAEKIPVVLTGSHNLDLFSLRTNDETLIEIRDQTVFNSYQLFLDRILDDARSAGLKTF
jgi:hypothetical protein